MIITDKKADINKYLQYKFTDKMNLKDELSLI